MHKKLVVEFDVIVPSHVSPETFEILLTNYINLLRFTTQLVKIEIFPVDTKVTIVPTFHASLLEKELKDGPK